MSAILSPGCSETVGDGRGGSVGCPRVGHNRLPSYAVDKDGRREDVLGARGDMGRNNNGGIGGHAAPTVIYNVDRVVDGGEVLNDNLWT